jgi:tetratricopeptide (TPR) repeat protein
MFAPNALLPRLEQSLRELVGGERDRPARQHTLREAIAWSYELLLPRERKAFTRLATFYGTFTLDAAEAVCDVDVETLAVLLDNNLVRRHPEPAPEARFALLETIHEFAAERLSESGEEPLLQRRLTAELLRKLDSSGARLGRHLAGIENAWLVAELPNLHGAVEWSLRSGEPANAARVAILLGRFLAYQRPTEGARRVRSILERRDTFEPPTVARLLYVLGFIEMSIASYEEATSLLTQAAAVFQSLGDDDGLGVALVDLSYTASYAGDVVAAREHATRADAVLARHPEDRWLDGYVRRAWAAVLEEEGVYDEAIAAWEAAHASFAAAGDTQFASIAIGNAGWVHLVAGDAIAAEVCIRDEFTPGPGYEATLVSANLATALLLQERPAEARPLYEQELDNMRFWLNERFLAEAVNFLAGLAALEGKTLTGARFAGAAESMLARIGSEAGLVERRITERFLDPLADDEGFAAARAAGRRLATDDVRREALEFVRRGAESLAVEPAAG